MISEKQFHKNLDKWAKVHPKEAVMLPYVDCDDIEFCKTIEGEWNLKRKINGNWQFIHSPSGAKKEAEKWFSSLKLTNIKVLYVYGVGLGYYHEAAKEWLKQSKDNHLVFLEDDPTMIHRLLETENGTNILKDKQTQLYFFHTIDDNDPTLNEVYWDYVLHPISVSSLHFYKKIKPEKFNDLNLKITYDTSLKNSLLEEYLRLGASFFRNFYSNIYSLPEASLGNALWGKFKNIPAIICGAGPSLENNISILKTLKEHAIIFAGSSAINAVTSGGVTPHLGAGIDPNMAQEERLSKVKDLTFPFLYRNRMYHPALNLVKGAKLYVTGAGGYDIAEWFEQCFGIEQDKMEEGRNVVNFCMEIAHKMGCNPIIFVGLDLAYTGQKAYTEGVVENAKEISIPWEVIEKDIHGKPIYTLWKWVAESRWIGDFAKEHPEITLLNATEGGIGFPNVPNKPLKDVSQRYLSQKHQLHARIQKEIDAGRLNHVTKQKIDQAMTTLLESLHKCLKYLDVLVEGTQSTQMTIAEAEIVEEPGYQHVLNVFSLASSKMLYKELRRIETGTLSKEKKAQKLTDLHKKKYQFLHQVASLNIHLIQQALKGTDLFLERIIS